MIRSMRITNFRSFVDTGHIELKPITVLVGRNSSGKSSALRVLPLIKQSVGAETKEPVLWFGGVDFGSFDQAFSRFANEGEGIGFEFSFEGLSKPIDEMLISEFGESFFIRPSSQETLLLDESIQVFLSQGLSAYPRGVGACSLSCRIGADVLELRIEESGFVTGIRFNTLSLADVGSVSAVVDKRGFFPRFMDNEKPTTAQRQQARRDGPFFTALFRDLDAIFHHKAKDAGKREVARKLKFGSSELFREHLLKVFVSTTGRIASLSESSFERLRGLVLLRMLPELTRRASQHLLKFCQGVRYIEPVRARALRYYRYQELAIDEIASDGSNVPMFLHSLTERERRDLQDWLSKSLGFAVRAERSGDGHIQLLVDEANAGSPINLADTGFGYSQILPIALQLWKTKRSKMTPQERLVRLDTNTMAIEQPELHLHPQMQALLADVFSLSINSATKTGLQLRLVLETHSEHLINRIGELIESGKINYDDVAVYVFERKDMGSPTSVRRANFSSGGFLQDPWPVGFFLPDLALREVEANAN